MSERETRKTAGEMWPVLRKLWKEANPDVQKGTSEKRCAEFYNKNKENPGEIQKKITELSWKKKNRAASSQLGRMFAKMNTKPRSSSSSAAAVAQQPDEEEPSSGARSSASFPRPSVGSDNGSDSELPEETRSNVRPVHPTPKQDAKKERLAKVNADLVSITQRRARGLGTTQDAEKRKKLLKESTDLEYGIRRLKSIAKAARKSRARKAAAVDVVASEHPELAAKLKDLVKKPVGRPRVELSQPALLKAIVDIVTFRSAAEGRRRDESLQYCRTLDELHTCLLEKGFSISRSALYLRLIPRRSNTEEGKQHVKTVPVRLIRAQNDGRRHHEDRDFAMETVSNLRDLAEFLGEKNVFVCSADDKANIALGLPAANKQAPILMHLAYRVQLPDHDWVVATRHKLKPSVYAGLAFDQKGKLSYSGPTRIAIRSCKHDSSTAYTHCFDFDNILDLEEFKTLAKRSNGDCKPIVMTFVDGGPDQNPRFAKPLLAAIHHFKKRDLDAIFVATNAPYHSAYNPVERRMAPLSRDLSGIILPHNHFGTHLNANGDTTDTELEKKNFEKAGSALAEIWNETVIDGYPVIAEYIRPGQRQIGSEPVSEAWKAQHVRQSQYLIQVRKCDNELCCGPMKTNLRSVLPDGFLPAPIQYEISEDGIFPAPNAGGKFLGLWKRLALKSLDPTHGRGFAMPYDYFCPSVDIKVDERCCDVCGLYLPSRVAQKSHKKSLHPETARRGRNKCNLSPDIAAPLYPSDSDDDDDGSDSDSLELEVAKDNGVVERGIHVIKDLSTWMDTEFEEM